MKNEMIVLTHIDLDAVGCMLNIEFKMPSIPKKYFYTNYADMDNVITEIEEYVKNTGISTILIADVSFSDNVQALRRLHSLGHCTLIDHHLYPKNFFDEFKGMNIIHDMSKCAASLCQEYFDNINENLEKLTYIINIYDTWQDDHRHFGVAQDLNDYFWTSTEYGKPMPLVKQIIQNDYKLPENYIDKVKEINTAFNVAMKDYEERKLIQRAGDRTIIFTLDWFNRILINEMKNGQNIIIGAGPSGIIKIRINKNALYTIEQTNQMRFKLTGTESIGHPHAFTWKIKGPISLDILIKEVQKVNTVIQEILNV